jgi:hypothetical protein
MKFKTRVRLIKLTILVLIIVILISVIAAVWVALSSLHFGIGVIPK